MASVTGGSVHCKMARLADTQTLGAHFLCQVVNSTIWMCMKVSFWNFKTLCIKMFASFKCRDCWERTAKIILTCHSIQDGVLTLTWLWSPFAVASHLPFLFHIVTLLVSTGPLSLRASTHGLVINIIHSLCTCSQLHFAGGSLLVSSAESDQTLPFIFGYRYWHRQL